MHRFVIILASLLAGCTPAIQPGDDVVTLDFAKATRSDGSTIDYVSGDTLRVMRVEGDACVVYGNELLTIRKEHLIPLTQAEQHFTRTIDEHPNDPLAWYVRSNFYNRQARFEESLSDATKAIELAPHIAA